MIKRIIIKQLHQSFDFDISFNNDLNILTGRNGAGKTTLLRIIWFLISGNIDKIVQNIEFKQIRIELANNGLIEIIKENGKEPQVTWNNLNLINEKNTFMLNTNSIFFPTFRRIEGGYNILPVQNQIQEPLNNAALQTSSIFGNSIHKFILSATTEDIATFITKNYTEILERIREFEGLHVENILKTTKDKKINDKDIINQIENQLKTIEEEKNKIYKPFTDLSNVVSEIFYDKAIRITPKLILGNSKRKIITSNSLSSGELQMLSFLAYNLFSSHSIMFVDEPELSLHIDWQRILIPTLLQYSDNNQFFIASHSPFIYSKFPDKEIILSNDKGDKQ